MAGAPTSRAPKLLMQTGRSPKCLSRWAPSRRYVKVTTSAEQDLSPTHVEQIKKQPWLFNIFPENTEALHNIIQHFFLGRVARLVDAPCSFAELNAAPSCKAAYPAG